MALTSLEELISLFARKSAEIAYYRERDWVIVDARDSQIDDGDIAALGTIVESGIIVHLNLAGSKVTNSSMPHIVKLLHLNFLDLGRTLCDESCLASLVGLSRLEGLGLSGMRLVTQSETLIRLRRLDVVDLSNTYVSRDLVRSLIQFSNISSLDLSGNGFEPDDFGDLDLLQDDSRTVSIQLGGGIRLALARPPLDRSFRVDGENSSLELR
jgi:Leucine-rich repeat (LRR) protein